MLSYLDVAEVYLDRNKLPRERDDSSVKSCCEINRVPAKVMFHEISNPRLCICTVTVNSIVIPIEKNALVMELVVLLNLQFLFGHLGFNPDDRSIFSRVVLPIEWGGLTFNQIDMVLENCKNNLAKLVSKLPNVLDGSMKPRDAVSQPPAKEQNAGADLDK